MNKFNETVNIQTTQKPEPIDAIVDVSVTKDALEANLNIKPPKYEGKNCSFLSIKKVLEEHKITYGVNIKVLLDISKNPIYHTNISIAKGLAPINGLDGSYELKFKTKKDLKPKKREDGTVDFFNLDNVVNVKKDDLLCEIVLPTEGVDGKSIFGKKITAIKGKAVSSMSGKNTILSEDGRAIFSAIDGQVDFIQNKITVNETFHIRKDVDNSTGNIKVIGNVVISGAVRSGFVVEATGNIQISGSIGAVTLISGGDILLRGGIIGGKINCQGNLTSKFIENCEIFVEADIKTNYIMNSYVVCGNNIETINSISKIVGGKCFAGGNIQAKTIGSPANIKTHLEIKVDPELLKIKEDLEKEITVLETQKNSLTSLIDILNQLDNSGVLTSDKRRSLEEAVYSYDKITISIENLQIKLKEIKARIQAKGCGKIVCKETLYSGTTVKIGSQSKYFNTSIIAKSIYNLDGDIHVSDL